MRLRSSLNVSRGFGFATQAVFGGLFLGALFFLSSVITHAETVAELQQKINDWNSQIASLEAEIAAYEEDLEKIGADRKTLESEIARLDLSRKKIATDIAVTRNRISATSLELQELEIEIEDKIQKSNAGKETIKESLRTISRIDDISIVEHFLSGVSFSKAWEDVDRLRRVQTVLNEEIKELLVIQQALEQNRGEVIEKQGALISFSKELSGQRSVLDETRRSQSTILSRTKNEEAEYQKLLQEKREAREQLESDLKAFESQLQYTLNPSSIPAVGSGILSFPLDTAVMLRCKDRERTYGNIYCITQYFGNTAFAQSGAYNGQGHNGIDFGASTGTKVISALAGIVEGVGDTDVAPGCYSYGKWVLVKHNNGLSTLYAHLSHISVSKGDAVGTGGLVGYSGNTGYSTGPHLHFTLFASDGVEVKNLRDWYIANGRSPSTGCAKGGVSIPVAPTQAYLNPFDYL